MACQQDTGIGFFTAPNFQDPSMKPEHKELPFTMIQNMRLIDPFVGR